MTHTLRNHISWRRRLLLLLAAVLAALALGLTARANPRRPPRPCSFAREPRPPPSTRR